MDNADAVRNPRYAGATIGGLVRALMRRPMKRKDEKPDTPPPPSEVRFRRTKKEEEGQDETC